MSRRLRYNVATSLDGFIAPPDGSTDWIAEDANIDFDALYAEFDAFVLGRKTYEELLRAERNGGWNPLKGKPKHAVHVVSRTLRQEDHPDVTIVNSDVTLHVCRLLVNSPVEYGSKKKDVWLYGGGELAAVLFDAGLVDSVEVAIMPVLLREGAKMMMGGAKTGSASSSSPSWGGGANRKLVLEGVETLTRSGIVMCRYSVGKDSKKEVK